MKGIISNQANANIQKLPSPHFEKGDIHIVTARHEGKDVLALTLSKKFIDMFNWLATVNAKVENLERAMGALGKEISDKEIDTVIKDADLAIWKIDMLPELRHDGLLELQSLKRAIPEGLVKHIEEWEGLLKRVKQQGLRSTPKDPNEGLQRRINSLEDSRREIVDMTAQQVKMSKFLLPWKQQQRKAYDLFHQCLKHVLGQEGLTEDEDISPQVSKEHIQALLTRNQRCATKELSQLSELPDVEELHRRTTEEEVNCKQIAHVEAQDEFLGWRARYDPLLAQFRGARKAGRHQGTSSFFAREYLLKGGQKARKFIEAEAEYEEVLARARALGILSNKPEQEFDFVDQSDDGYELEWDVWVASTVNRPRIELWLQQTLECELLNPNTKCRQDRKVEIDEWKYRQVEMWDSVSAVDDGRRRKEIDRHRAKYQQTPSSPLHKLRRRRKSIDYDDGEQNAKRQRST